MNGLGKWIVLRDGVVVWDYAYSDDAEAKAEPGDTVVYGVPGPTVRHVVPIIGAPLEDGWRTGPDPQAVAVAVAQDAGRLL